jgi:hypothetical protein
MKQHDWLSYSVLKHAVLYFLAFPALSRDVDLQLSKHGSTFSERGFFYFWLSPSFTELDGVGLITPRQRYQLFSNCRVWKV